jgi:hypothetical protein
MEYWNDGIMAWQIKNAFAQYSSIPSFQYSIIFWQSGTPDPWPALN